MAPSATQQRMRFSMSEYGRVERCPPSAVLGKTFHDAAPPTDAEKAEARRWAERGTVIHKYLADVLTLGDWESALAQVPEEWRVECAKIELHQLPASKPDEYVAEVAWAYNWDAGVARELYRGHGERTYQELDPCEIPGTADLVSLRPDAVDVDDYKTGYRYLGGAADSWQLKLYALAAARCYDRPRARVRFIRLSEDGTPYFITADLSEMELDLIEEQVRETMRTVKRLEQQGHSELVLLSNFREGEHCSGCKSFLRCPAKLALASSMANGSFSLTDPAVALMISPETAPGLVRRIADVKKVVTAVEEQLKEYARTNPIDLGEGWVYGPVAVPTRTIDPELAIPLLKARFDDKVIEEAVKVETSIGLGDLEDAVKSWCERQPEKPKKGATWMSTVNMLSTPVPTEEDHGEKDSLAEARPAMQVTQRVDVKRHKPKDQKGTVK